MKTNFERSSRHQESAPWITLSHDQGHHLKEIPAAWSPKNWYHTNSSPCVQPLAQRILIKTTSLRSIVPDYNLIRGWYGLRNLGMILPSNAFQGHILRPFLLLCHSALTALGAHRPHIWHRGATAGQLETWIFLSLWTARVQRQQRMSSQSQGWGKAGVLGNTELLLGLPHLLHQEFLQAYCLFQQGSVRLF